MGGGMAGLFAALAAARRGVDTVLVHDRPVLGGNASKEVRVTIDGAEGGANNRYHRETGILEEIRLDNLHRNPDGNADVWDALLLEKALGEPNLRLFLNTSACAAGKSGAKLSWVEGYQQATERRFRFHAEYFADCTGDGTVGALAGARFMWGREARSRFGESLAPVRSDPHTMGGTILYDAKDTGRPVKFIPPAWAHKFTRKTFRFRELPPAEHGQWWYEWGGMKNTIRDNEEIRMELLRITFGAWDFIKNSGIYGDKVKNLQLEWVGTVVGKRENRRFVGDHILTQGDVIEKPRFPDAVAVGGWSIDDHPSSGFYDPRSPSSHYYLPGMYNIPLRSLYSKDVANLFFAGRDASFSHQALSTTRVIATCAQMGEAVGAAAALALRERTAPRAIATGPLAHELQQDLLRADHYIVGVRNEDPRDLARAARVTASSCACAELGPASSWWQAKKDLALMFPVAGAFLGSVKMDAYILKPGRVGYALYGPDPKGDFLPGPLIKEGHVSTGRRGRGWLNLPLSLAVRPGFYWLEVRKNSVVKLGMTREQRPGIITSVRGLQKGADYNWVNRYSPWWPIKENPSFSVTPRQESYRPESVVNGFSRPFRNPNVWISEKGLPQWLRLEWDKPRKISLVQVRFDTDLDGRYANLRAEYKNNVHPQCVRDYRIWAVSAGGKKKLLVAVRGNYQRVREHPVRATVKALRLEILATNGARRAGIYEVRVY